MKYKLSRALTAPERKSLKAALAGLEKAGADFALAVEAAEGRATRLRGLEAKAAKLEVQADKGSEDASSKLVGARDQIERLKAGMVRGVVGLDALSNAIHGACDVASPICLEDLREQIRDLAESRNADLFLAPERARQVAFDSDAARALQNLFFISPFPLIESRVPEGERLLLLVQQLLAGGVIWEFPPPKPGAKSKSRR